MDNRHNKIIGTVEILRTRVYPRATDHAEIVVEPGIFPLYETIDGIKYWVMKGRLNERFERLGDGIFALYPGDRPTGEMETFRSPDFDPEAWEDFLLKDPVCMEDDPEQRLRITLNE